MFIVSLLYIFYLNQYIYIFVPSSLISCTSNLHAIQEAVTDGVVSEPTNVSDVTPVAVFVPGITVVLKTRPDQSWIVFNFKYSFIQKSVPDDISK